MTQMGADRLNATIIGRVAFGVASVAICAFNVGLLYALWFRPIGEWNVYALTLTNGVVANIVCAGMILYSLWFAYGAFKNSGGAADD